MSGSPFRVLGIALALFLFLTPHADAQQREAGGPAAIQAANARIPLTKATPPSAARVLAPDSIVYDDRNATPDDFLGFGSATGFYAATRFTTSSAFTLTGTRFAYRTEMGTQDLAIAVYDDAAGPNSPTGGNLLFFGSGSALSPDGRFIAVSFDPVPEPFQAGESFFIVVGFLDVPFPMGTDDEGTGNYTGRCFFSGTSAPNDWTALGDILGNGQQDAWVLRALGDSGGGGGNVPDIAVTPSSLAATLPAGASTTLSLTIGNTGAGSLWWNAAATANRPAEAEPSLPVAERYGASPSASDFAVLRAIAQRKGSVSVIVGLNTAFRPEGELGRFDAVAQQREQIASAREALLGRLAAYDVQAVKTYETVPYVAMTVDAAGLDALAADPGVYDVHEDVLYRTSLAQSTAIVGAPAAWQQGFSGVGQTVAVLDTGTEVGHPFFGGRAVAEACFSSIEPGVAQSNCPNGQTEQIGPGAAAPCSIDGCNHGTHVSGIAVGRGNAFSGVGRDANLIAVQVFTTIIDAQICGGQAPCALSATSDQMRGLEYVYGQRNTFAIASINMSIGGGRFTSACDDNPLKPVIDNLRAAGIATVIAAGNEGFTDSMGAPACISTAVSVGSTQDGSGGTIVDAVSPFSNSSADLDLLAPGQVITSSMPGGTFGDLSGTSMAAPHIAGAWAVLKGQRPQASVTEILNAIASTGVSITDPRNNIARPRLQLDAALNGGGGASWIAVTPNSGTTAPGASSTLTVGLSAIGLQAGTYTGAVVITSNDPDEATVTVPVTLTVEGGGTGGGVLTYLTDNDTQNAFTTQGGGYVHGTNEFTDLGKAVAFEVPGGGMLEGVDVYLSARAATPALVAYTLKVYGGTATTGPQGSPLFSQIYTLADAQVDGDPATPSPPTELRFAPISVPASFFVSIEFAAPYGTDDFTIAATQPLGSPSPFEWELWSDNTWHNMSQAWFQNADDGWHMWVEALMGNVVANEGESGIPEQVALEPNYPNPFAPSTTIRYALPRASDVRLEVFDALGRRVATLADAEQAAGTHEVTWDARGLASGIYVARLTAAGAVETQRMTLLR